MAGKSDALVPWFVRDVDLRPGLELDVTGVLAGDVRETIERDLARSLRFLTEGREPSPYVNIICPVVVPGYSLVPGKKTLKRWSLDPTWKDERVFGETSFDSLGDMLAHVLGDRRLFSCRVVFEASKSGIPTSAEVAFCVSNPLPDLEYLIRYGGE